MTPNLAWSHSSSVLELEVAHAPLNPRKRQPFLWWMLEIFLPFWSKHKPIWTRLPMHSMCDGPGFSGKDSDKGHLHLCFPHETMLASEVKSQKCLKKRGRENLVDQIKHIYYKRCPKIFFPICQNNECCVTNPFNKSCQLLTNFLHVVRKRLQERYNSLNSAQNNWYKKEKTDFPINFLTGLKSLTIVSSTYKHYRQCSVKLGEVYVLFCFCYFKYKRNNYFEDINYNRLDNHAN